MKWAAITFLAALLPAYFISHWAGPSEWRWWAAILSVGFYAIVVRARP